MRGSGSRSLAAARRASARMELEGLAYDLGVLDKTKETVAATLMPMSETALTAGIRQKILSIKSELEGLSSEVSEAKAEKEDLTMALRQGELQKEEVKRLEAELAKTQAELAAMQVRYQALEARLRAYESVTNDVFAALNEVEGQSLEAEIAEAKRIVEDEAPTRASDSSSSSGDSSSSDAAAEVALSPAAKARAAFAAEMKGSAPPATPTQVEEARAAVAAELKGAAAPLDDRSAFAAELKSASPAKPPAQPAQPAPRPPSMLSLQLEKALNKTAVAVEEKEAALRLTLKLEAELILERARAERLAAAVKEIGGSVGVGGFGGLMAILMKEEEYTTETRKLVKQMVQRSR